MGFKEPDFSAEIIPKSSEAGSTWDHSTKLRILFRIDYAHDLTQVGPENLRSAIWDLQVPDSLEGSSLPPHSVWVQESLEITCGHVQGVVDTNTVYRPFTFSVHVIKKNLSRW